jgi:hypothetical protein
MTTSGIELVTFQLAYFTCAVHLKGLAASYFNLNIPPTPSRTEHY